MKSLVAFSHLRWDAMRRRPQHLLSRLARHWPVIFIEEPIPGSDRNGLAVFEPEAGVQVWRPHLVGDAPGFHDTHLPVLQKLVTGALQSQHIFDYWLWFCTPMALPLASGLTPRGLVYDCMQELGCLRDAPRQLAQRENALFKHADLVFAAGRSIYEAKRNRHPDVHCFPNSVDAKHFAGVQGEHRLQAAIPRPRLGYQGAIDDRLNLELIAAVAKGRPEWNIVMAGPVEDIDATTLPRADNIHWLGLQDYDDLPALMSGWDVCLMPYSLNETTRCISPSKPLEYMACGRPVVSTSIRDVVEAYGQVVRIADTPEGFIADCEMLMQRTRAELAQHARALADVVARTSWDATANAMAELIAQADELADCAAAFAQARATEKEPAAVPRERSLQDFG